MERESRLLIVDDNATTRYAMRRVLERHGYQVLEAGTGSEGLALLASAMPDALVLDVNLPDMKGYEAVQVLKTIDPEIQIIMTAFENTLELETKIRQQDIFYYYIKSFDTKELKEAVHDVFKKLERLKR